MTQRKIVSNISNHKNPLRIRKSELQHIEYASVANDIRYVSNTTPYVDIIVYSMK